MRFLLLAVLCLSTLQAEDLRKPLPRLSVKISETPEGKVAPKGTAKTATLKADGIKGRTYFLAIIWIGSEDRKPAIYRSEMKKISADGEQTFSVEFNSDKSNSDDYRGFTAALLDEVEKPVVVTSSQEPFKRFWDEKWRGRLPKK